MVNVFFWSVTVGKEYIRVVICLGRKLVERTDMSKIVIIIHKCHNNSL